MTQFIYYSPEAEAGPTYPFDGSNPASRLVLQNGPDGGRGNVYAATTDGLGYFPQKQTWRQIPGAPHWVGFDTANPPKPQDLQREHMLPGLDVRLGDGNKWCVPIARRFVDHDDNMILPVCILPRAYEFGQDGKWSRGEILGRYKPLWEIAVHAWAIFNGEDVDSSETWIAQACACVLAANYRVSEIEVGMLGLIDDAAACDILYALTDRNTFDTWFKKKWESGDLSGDGGQEDTTTDSTQP